MHRYFLTSLFLALIFFPFLVLSSENNCVNCHREVVQQDTAQPAHSFAEWEKSVHAKNGVTCDVCHGGDPSAKDKAAAHKNVARSSDQESRIYFNKLPDTCGACHAQELKGFKESAHYKELESSGKGPNCVTCHGSMATRVMTPREMESICTICHRRPTYAYAALLTLQSSQKLLDQLRSQLKLSQEQHLDVSGQSADLDRAKQTYRQTLQLWHMFDMSKVMTESQNLNQLIRNDLHEIELKKVMPSNIQEKNEKKRGQ